VGGCWDGLDAGCKLGILICEHAHNARGDFVMDSSFIVFTDDIDAIFLGVVWVGCVDRWNGGRCWRRTTVSSFFSSKGSDSTPSGLSRSPFMKVPFELFTSLIYIFHRTCQSFPSVPKEKTHLAIILPYLRMLSTKHF
jgi:hypothetical protein